MVRWVMTLSLYVRNFNVLSLPFMTQTNQLDRDELDEQLRQMIATTCQHPPGSFGRQKGLNQIIGMIQQSGQLLRSGAPYYEDALQQTWLYFCRNLDKYASQKGSVINWLNVYLSYRLEDLRTQVREEAVRTVYRQISESDEPLDPVENLPGREEPRMLEEILEWVEKDPGGELRRTHIRNHREITCQVLIRRRLPPRTPWEKLAKEFNVPVGTLSSFYQRECFPRLLKFGEEQGYFSED